MAKRQVFFSFHYDNDNWRAGQVRNMGKMEEASGHVGGFSDPLIDCKACKSRFRADKLIEENRDSKNEDKIIFYRISPTSWFTIY